MEYTNVLRQWAQILAGWARVLDDVTAGICAGRFYIILYGAFNIGARIWVALKTYIPLDTYRLNTDAEYRVHSAS